jgi:hypothetical protein
LGLGDARIIVETLIVSYILEGGRIVFLGGIETKEEKRLTISKYDQKKQ